MKLHFLVLTSAVTGSCHCLEVNGKRILIDCGLQQGRDEVDNSSLPFHAGNIDYVLVTHAHIDHSGRIPLLVKQGVPNRISPPGSPPSLWTSCSRTRPISRSPTPSTKTARTSGPVGRWWSRLHRGGRPAGEGVCHHLRIWPEGRPV